tara:strand:+ start:922 stop:1161 length:240 start_codon:yes stop_codon:yes gene_type:complete
MAIEWKAKICSGMDVVEKIKFIKQGIDSNGNKITASSVYVPSGDDEYKTRSEWSDEEINAIADKVSNDLDNEIKRQGGS